MLLVILGEKGGLGILMGNAYNFGPKVKHTNYSKSYCVWWCVTVPIKFHQTH